MADACTPLLWLLGALLVLLAVVFLCAAAETDAGELPRSPKDFDPPART